jgi:1-acyl-sn-glycerol-3-phosphate acyltransferase
MSSAHVQSPADWAVWQHDGYNRGRRFLQDIFFQRFLVGLFWNLHIEGLDYVPTSGPALLMMSHSVMMDTTVPLGVIKSRYVVPMSKEENFTNPFTRGITEMWGAFPIKRGTVDRRALQIVQELLKRDELVLIMPEGTRTPALTEAKDGLAYLALKADVPIIPAAVWGLENYAVDFFKVWMRSQAHIRFGRPFRLNSGGRRRVPRQEMAVMTREMMYQLAQVYPPHKRGYYSDLSQLTTDTLLFDD